MFRVFWFRFLSVFFIIAAVYHAVEFLIPTVGIHAAHWRHAAFVFIDIACAWFILQRPLWFKIFVILLSIQQIYSHGFRSWIWLHNNHRLDWISFVVLFLILFTATMLIKDNMQKDNGHVETDHS
jgi:hypothetical protein